MDTSRDDHFMGLALAEAEAAVGRGQLPFGAVLVDDAGTVVGAGHNQVRGDRDPTAHGEMVALRRAWARLGDRERLAACTLYTSCEPCLMCSVAIAQFAIPRVVFAARAEDVPTSRPLLGATLTQAAAWIEGREGWAPLEVRAEFRRADARQTLDAFDWG